LTHAGSLAPGERVNLTADLPPGTERLTAVLEYHVPARTTVPLGEPLAFTAIASLFVPEDAALVLHPTALAGWGMLLVTGIILLPVGRLDGGGVARALLGDRMVLLGYITIGFLAVLSFFYAGWVYLVLFILLFVSVRHPVPLDDTTPLSGGRRALVVVLVLILIVSFIPIPAQLPGLGLFP
jgi:membrane-associated protease RseP (regulator of RpoE activity)